MLFHYHPGTTEGRGGGPQEGMFASTPAPEHSTLKVSPENEFGLRRLLPTQDRNTPTNGTSSGPAQLDHVFEAHPDLPACNGSD